MKPGAKTRAHKKACKDYKQRFYELHGYLFCEQCKRSDKQYSVHHIQFVSKSPLHPKLHNDSNLILLCQECHDGFHWKHSITEYRKKTKQLKQERGLYKLFRR